MKAKEKINLKIIREKLEEVLEKARLKFQKYPKRFIGLASILILMTLFALVDSGAENKHKRIVHHNGPVNFKGGRIIGSGRNIYQRKEKMISNQIDELTKLVKRREEKQRNLEEEVKNLKNALKSKEKEGDKAVENEPLKTLDQEVTFSPSPPGFSPSRYDENDLDSTSKEISGLKKKKIFKPLIKKVSRGPSIISFPVEEKRSLERDQVTIPSGSFVKATMLTGVEAPEGKALPVLLKADFAFVGPNKTRIDMSGCFFIGKSTGNLSIERVELQIVKMSCVAKSGKSFENDVSGFVADKEDSSFAVMGSVNGKRDRVAALAFLSSVVEGIGKAIQQGQTQAQTNALGSSSLTVTGDQTKHMLAGGASTAAGRITDFYLKHAESLLPTINVESGKQVFIVMQNKIALPNWFFKKASKKKSDHFSYLSRILE